MNLIGLEFAELAPRVHCGSVWAQLSALPLASLLDCVSGFVRLVLFSNFYIAKRRLNISRQHQ